MLASDLIDRAGWQLQDRDHVRWTENELIAYINDAQKQVVLMRPDANSITESVPLAAGTRQALPAGAVSLLAVTRNMGADGNTPGRSIRPTIRTVLDTETPDWHGQTGSYVQHYIYDPANDRQTFYVYPAATGQIEIVYSSEPATITASTDTLDLGDQYIGAVLDWVLFRCYSKDAEYAGDPQKASGHLSNFYQTIGVKTEADLASNPTRRVRNAEIELR